MRVSTHPAVDLALVATDFSSDMILNDRCQGGLVGDGTHPAWKLRMPHSRVTANQHLVGCRPVDKIVEAGKVKVAPAGFDSIPFSTVFLR